MTIRTVLAAADEQDSDTEHEQDAEDDEGHPQPAGEARRYVAM
ncbi:hypothetical protein [Pseudonocardia humida]|nr:hypothetical protein [Pseudonocardia humida]